MEIISIHQLAALNLFKEQIFSLNTISYHNVEATYLCSFSASSVEFCLLTSVLSFKNMEFITESNTTETNSNSISDSEDVAAMTLPSPSVNTFVDIDQTFFR